MYEQLEEAGTKLAITLLEHYLQNPAKAKEAAAAIHQIATLATQADEQVNVGTAWTFTPSAPAQSKESK